jgi:hypothetical protein
MIPPRKWPRLDRSTALLHAPPPRVVVTATFLLAFLLYVDRVCISTAKAPICRAGSFRWFGWALGVCLFTHSAGSGRALADRYGARVISQRWSASGRSSLVSTRRLRFSSMLVVRFLFGAGEAGAFPGMARAVFSWISRARARSRERDQLFRLALCRRHNAGASVACDHGMESGVRRPDGNRIRLGGGVVALVSRRTAINPASAAERDYILAIARARLPHRAEPPRCRSPRSGCRQSRS